MISTFSSERIAYTNITPDTYVSTDNLLQNCEGVVPYDGVPDVDSIVEYKKGDILLLLGFGAGLTYSGICVKNTL